MPANVENSAVATGLEKSVFIPISKKSNGKEYSNYHTVKGFGIVNKAEIDALLELSLAFSMIQWMLTI